MLPQSGIPRHLRKIYLRSGKLFKISGIGNLATDAHQRNLAERNSMQVIEVTEF
jgi:hypothetical protein